MIRHACAKVFDAIASLGVLLTVTAIAIRERIAPSAISASPERRIPANVMRAIAEASVSKVRDCRRASMAPAAEAVDVVVPQGPTLSIDAEQHAWLTRNRDGRVDAFTPTADDQEAAAFVERHGVPMATTIINGTRYGRAVQGKATLKS